MPSMSATSVALITKFSLLGSVRLLTSAHSWLVAKTLYITGTQKMQYLAIYRRGTLPSRSILLTQSALVYLVLLYSSGALHLFEHRPYARQPDG